MNWTKLILTFLPFYTLLQFLHSFRLVRHGGPYMHYTSSHVLFYRLLDKHHDTTTFILMTSFMTSSQEMCGPIIEEL